jgi:hypothetical protein
MVTTKIRREKKLMNFFTKFNYLILRIINNWTSLMSLLFYKSNFFSYTIDVRLNHPHLKDNCYFNYFLSSKFDYLKSLKNCWYSWVLWKNLNFSQHTNYDSNSDQNYVHIFNREYSNMIWVFLIKETKRKRKNP